MAQRFAQARGAVARLRRCSTDANPLVSDRRVVEIPRCGRDADLTLYGRLQGAAAGDFGDGRIERWQQSALHKINKRRELYRPSSTLPSVPMASRYLRDTST